MIKLDTYSIKARVYPAFVVLLPILVLALFYITDFKVYYHYITAFISVGFLSFILAQLGRDQGKNKETILFESIGGKPTNQILRHTNNHLDKTTKARYHNGLSEKIQEISIPTLEQEQANPQKSDEIFESCTKYLISKTRDTEKFNLLFKENINYGFRRNLWGMKMWGMIILIASAIAHMVIATDFFTNIGFKPTSDTYPYLAFFVLGAFWIFVVTKNWVKITAFAYAERLYETIEEI
jgi:hypothetical protein